MNNKPNINPRKRDLCGSLDDSIRMPPPPPTTWRPPRRRNHNNDDDDHLELSSCSTMISLHSNKRSRRGVAFSLDEFGRENRPPSYNDTRTLSPPLLPQKQQQRGRNVVPLNNRSVYYNDSSSSFLSSQRSASMERNTNFATSAISINETNHGRERRIQRSIPTRDIQEAIKYGIKESHPHNPSLLIYKYNGKEHIVTRDTTLLVTTMVKTFELERKRVTSNELRDHQKAWDGIHGKNIIKFEKNDTCIEVISSNCSSCSGDDQEKNVNRTNNKMRLKREVQEEFDEEDDMIHMNNEINHKWRSHSVIVVDKSGSMRNSDVNGSRTRFGAVWLALAQDYIEQRLNSGAAGLYDVVSIILMGEDADLLIDRWPTSNVLFNKIVDLFHQSEEADKLKNQISTLQKRGGLKARCKNPFNAKKLHALVRPSGHGCYGPSLLLAEEILEKNDNDSCALSLLLLSDGRPSDSTVFKHDVKASAKVLKDITGRMASKFGRRLTFSTIGMGSSNGFETLESLVDSAKDFGGNATFSVPSLSSAAIGRAISSVATSLTTTQTELMVSSRGNTQRRVRPCIRESKRLIPLWTEAVDSAEFDIYMNSAVEHYEYKEQNGEKTFVKSTLQHPDAAGVAMKRRAFGEGQERFAFQFFEIGSDGSSVVGPPFVAKESRFIHESVDGVDNWKNRDKFAKRFCKVQMAARNAAIEFNNKLDAIPNLDPETARVNFLNCSIYYLTHPTKGEFAVIVEQKLDGEFQKWNNNNGWHICRDKLKPTSKPTLDTVSEVNDSETAGTENNPIEIDGGIFVKKEEVAQAFSHFSHVYSGQKMLVCDLQGVYIKSSNVFNFTDPVIHYHDAKKESKRNRGVYGRTDMGQKGIQNFFRTHQCNCLCDLMTKGFISVSR